MKVTLLEAMTSWSDFLAWCTRQDKKPAYYTTMQEYLSQKSQVNQPC